MPAWASVSVAPAPMSSSCRARRAVQRDARGRRWLARQVSLDRAQGVEVPGATLGVARPRDVAVRGAHHGDARGQGERLVHPGQGEVDAVIVEVDGAAADGADDVDQEQGLGVLGERRRDARQRGQDAGGGLVHHQRDGVEGSGLGQGVRQGLGGHRRAPVDADRRHVLAHRLGDPAPALGEGAVDDAQHARADRHQRALHHRRGAVRADGHARGRVGSQPEGQPQARVDAFDELGHRRAAVSDHRQAQFVEELGAHLGRAGNPQHGFSRLGVRGRAWRDPAASATAGSRPCRAGAEPGRAAHARSS